MKFILEYASNDYKKREIEINTLDDLILIDKLANENHKNYTDDYDPYCSMIIDFKHHVITIYDDWIE